MSYSVYRLVSWILWLVAGPLLAVRVRKGKEDPARLNERYARGLPPRPAGRVIWLHGASVGETALLLGMVEAWTAAQDDGSIFLFTSQTLTSASMFSGGSNRRVIHQFAPLDTQGATARFITHWRPDIGIFAEGEIWPNLLDAANRAGVPLALINARMTEKSRNAWRKRGAFGRAVFSKFAWVSAANTATALTLSAILGREIEAVGNIKLALKPSDPQGDIVAAVRDNFVTGRRCILAASTHPDEERFFLEAFARLENKADYCAIIAPRHPERGAEIAALLADMGLSYAQRSTRAQPSKNTQIYLADTLGEMPNWFALADCVYLGGGTKSGVGGHNPIEILHFQNPIATGPHVFNFTDIIAALEDLEAVQTVDSSLALSQWIMQAAQHKTTDWARIDTWLSAQNQALPKTLTALTTVLDTQKKAR